MHNTFLLRLSCEHLHACDYLRISKDQTLYQLHEAIAQLYHRNKKDAFVFYANAQSISSHQAKKATTIERYMNTQAVLRYESGKKEDRFCVHIHPHPEKDAIPQKDISSYSERIHTAPSIAHSAYEEGNELLASLCERIRTKLMGAAMITPYLILLHMDYKAYPLYIDALDNGLELMIFEDMSAFERSILYSCSEDPDLLFTDACVIDFLYEDLKESDLPLYDHHNLCFQMKPGRLPGSFETKQQERVIALLTSLLDVLDQQPKLPTLKKQEMLQIKEGITEVCAYTHKESIHLSSYILDQQRWISYPHTNEAIHLILQVKANENMRISHAYEIVLHAFNAQFHQEYQLSADSLEKDICDAILEMCGQRGLMEQLHLYSCNLYRSIHMLCKELQIGCFLHVEDSEKAHFLQDAITDRGDALQKDIDSSSEPQYKKLWSC